MISCPSPRTFILLLILALLPCLAATQSVRINEIMSSNSAFLADEDGDYSDWLELYNSSSSAINLANWGLTDKPTNLRKWTLPDVTMPPGAFMLIFASSKDRKQMVSHWETIIRQGALWRYRAGSAAIPATWSRPEFDDTGWSQGPSGIGFGDGDDATVVPQTISVFARTAFFIQDSAAVQAMILDIDYDDGFVAWLNGKEIARANLGQAGIAPAWDLGAANSDHEAAMYRNLPPDRFVIANYRSFLRKGRNVLAIQVHNSTAASSDISLIPFLSLGYTDTPANPVGSAPVLGLEPSYLHTNFAISASGETLVLSDPAGILVDSVKVPSLAADITYARIPDGGARWTFASQPTPDSANHRNAATEAAGPVSFSIAGGFYQQPLSVALTCAMPGAEIRYTRDGAEPDSLSPLYSGSVGIGQTTAIRARAFVPGYLPGPVITHTFIFSQPPAPLPVIALTTDPYNLWDQEYGIYVLGATYENKDPYFGANFWEDWERPIHIEFFEPGGALGFRQDAGVKIFGAWSRARSQKSLAFFARESYGKDKFSYRIFPKLPYEDYHSFVLRNGGNDWDHTLFADGLIHSLVDGIDLEHQAYRPCTVYLNGEYWGILNLREKVNEYFLAQHKGGDPKKMDMLEFDGTVIEGSADHYTRLINYISTHDLAVTANYDYVKTQMDVDNFITYEAVQIYIDNRDWPGNNIKFWRPQSTDGRWRWILFDTEWGFGINAYGAAGNPNAYTYNTLAFATSPTQTPNHHANPPWSTLLLRRLLMNISFKSAFINRFADLMNGAFRETPVAARIDSLKNLLSADMPRQYEKWKQPMWWVPASRLWWSSMGDWYQFIQILRDFGRNRPPYMRSHIMQKFAIQKTATLQLVSTPAQGGTFILNDFLAVSDASWFGIYFTGIPIRISARAKPGYRFIGWEGASDSGAATVELTLTQGAVLTARFAADGGGSDTTTVQTGTVPQLPAQIELAQNHPNPFNQETSLTYDLPRPDRVRIDISDIKGRHIRTLLDGMQPAGRHEVRWDGRDESGESVSSGIYLCLLRSGAEQRMRRLLLLR